MSMDSSSRGDWIIWQLLDSLFPTGGFAHSFGLEAAVQERLVVANDSDSLHRFLDGMLHQTANLSLPIVFTAVTLQPLQVDTFLALNDQVNALLITNSVALKASIAQGNALLRVALTLLNTSQNQNHTMADPQLLVEVRRALRQRQRQQYKTPQPDDKSNSRNQHFTSPSGCHHAVIFGCLCQLLGLDAAQSQRMYLFLALRDMLSAATRLNLIGPLESASIQFAFRDTLEQLFEAKRDRPIDDAVCSAALWDLVQNLHEQLYTRIFNS